MLDLRRDIKRFFCPRLSETKVRPRYQNVSIMGSPTNEVLANPAEIISTRVVGAVSLNIRPAVMNITALSANRIQGIMIGQTNSAESAA